MIDFYYWPSPNGRRAAIMLEECGLDYTVKPINLKKGEQFAPAFLTISPNNKMPAIVDHDTGGEPISVFESGAILLYLAEKTGQFVPTDPGGRVAVLEWLFWQCSGMGPTAGQMAHFLSSAPEGNDYAAERFEKEYERLLGVLDRRLDGREFITGAYSIADMASWPWVMPAIRFGFDLDGFASVKRWFGALKQRPAVAKAAALGADW